MKVMIDEKKIEEAAEKYAIDTYAFDEPVPTEYKEGIQEIFQTSINWFKENLWHDASEVPTHDCALVEYKDGNYGIASFMIFDKLVNVTRWLYIEELKKGKING